MGDSKYGGFLLSPRYSSLAKETVRLLDYGAS